MGKNVYKFQFILNRQNFPHSQLRIMTLWSEHLLQVRPITLYQMANGDVRFYIWQHSPALSHDIILRCHKLMIAVKKSHELNFEFLPHLFCSADLVPIVVMISVQILPFAQQKLGLDQRMSSLRHVKCILIVLIDGYTKKASQVGKALIRFYHSKCVNSNSPIFQKKKNSCETYWSMHYRM